MQKRHDDILTSRLEEIYTNGVAYVSWNELYLWYDVQAIAARTYRDLSNRWDEISAGWTNADGTGLGNLLCICSPGKIKPGMFLFGANMPTAVFDQSS